MALDIGIQSNNKKDPLIRDLVVSLEEVDIAFLGNVFLSIKEQAGVEITSYDDARLQGKQLDLLDSLLVDSLAEIALKPKQWDEYIGFQVKPRKKLYSLLIKSQLQAKVNNLRKLITQAKSEEKVLFFFGD